MNVQYMQYDFANRSNTDTPLRVVLMWSHILYKRYYSIIIIGSFLSIAPVLYSTILIMGYSPTEVRSLEAFF